VQPFQIISQTNQGPLAISDEQAPQGKLAKAQHFLDDANHGFNRLFTQAVDSFANGGTQFVSHLLFDRSIFWRWGRIVQKISLPPTSTSSGQALMMGAATGRDVGVNPSRRQTGNIVFAEVASVQIGLLRLPHGQRHSVDGRQGGLLIIGMITQPVANDQAAIVPDNNLHIVSWSKPLLLAFFMIRDSGSVKLYWSLARGPGVGGLGGRPGGLPPF
jgi:hypothetical protein